MTTTVMARLTEALGVEGGWSGADWTHEYVDEGRPEDRESGSLTVPLEAGGEMEDEEEDEPIYCQGATPGCAVCADAEEDAERACERYDLALEAAGRGDLDGAIEYLREAVGIEREWGDAPAYGPVLRVAEALRGAAAEDE